MPANGPPGPHTRAAKRVPEDSGPSAAYTRCPMPARAMSAKKEERPAARDEVERLPRRALRRRVSLGRAGFGDPGGVTVAVPVARDVAREHVLERHDVAVGPGAQE